MSALSAGGLQFSELMVEVFRLNGLALSAGNVLSEPAGLSAARWQILGVVDHQPSPVAAIARAMGLTRQSVQQTADAMFEDGFVELRENPDHARAKLLAITPKGRKALRAVEKRHATWANALAQRIGSAVIRQALTGLRATRVTMEQER